jgi:formylglycine-generating enzyme required for sulfatase activity
MACYGFRASAGDSKPVAPADFKEYVQTIPESDVAFKMVPIPGGKFTMGSPETEKGRSEDEGPQIEIEIQPFWMGACEVTWSEFDIFAFKYDIKAAQEATSRGKTPTRTADDVKADAVTRPTPPYVDMTFGYGHDGYPAICMTQHAAAQYCKWLATKTGKPYRLPTEAEWEYACRAGSKTAYFFGDDPAKLGEYAWYFENSNEKPQPVGKKKPNPWGLYDIHGNVSEWCQDNYMAEYFGRLQKAAKPVRNPLLRTDENPWNTVRGGSWEDDAVFCRSAARRGAEEEWSIQDPQSPKSIWWHTDAHFVGFRVVRPYEPKKEQADAKPAK